MTKSYTVLALVIGLVLVSTATLVPPPAMHAGIQDAEAETPTVLTRRGSRPAIGVDVAP
jgi:hypothetical protein